VVVGNRTHRALLSAEVSEFPAATVLLQPGNRGTGPGVLFPVSWIARHDPRATVAVFPSDHFILGGNAFIAHVAQARAFVDLHPEWILLVGAPATRPETEFGWIEAGERVGATASGPICRVRRFREKPDRDEARRCLRTGCLWNTFVMVGRASAMLEAAKAASRPVLEACEHAARASCACNADALDEIYAPLPTLDFSRAILEQSTDRLVVSRLPAGIWSDLGTPQRVLRSLTEADMPIPEWMGRGENATGRPVDPVEGVPA
jgi:mannose-1-phosphate guanylyltransferase